MRTISNIMIFLLQYLSLVLCIASVIAVFLLIHIAIDSVNPCSNFSRHGSCEAGRL